MRCISNAVKHNFRCKNLRIEIIIINERLKLKENIKIIKIAIQSYFVKITVWVTNSSML